MSKLIMNALVLDAQAQEAKAIANLQNYMTNSADGAQSYKYVVRNIAQKFGKVATMMPKPISMDSGSGMHTNVSLWKNDKNTFLLFPQ